jgi:YesN/AraC family two-component response regulator
MEFDIQEVYAKIRSFESYDDLVNWFEELFYKTENIMCNIKNKKNPDLIEQVLRYINEAYKESNISANIIADKLSITPQYFSKIFNEYVGVSFPDYINNVRMEKAKELLLSSDKLNISSIYEMVGYNNRSYFTSSFTKKYGISPGRFRSEIASKKISEP